MLGKDYASPVGRASVLVLILGSILQTPPAFAEPLRGSTGDPEADFNWGLSAVNAQKAHQAGFTGRVFGLAYSIPGWTSRTRNSRGG